MRVSALPRGRGRRVRIQRGGRGVAVRDPASGRSSGSPATATRRPARGPGGGYRDLLAEQRPDRELGRIVVAVKRWTSTLWPVGSRSSASRIRARAFLGRPRVASGSADERASLLGPNTPALDDEQERRWRLLLRDETSGLPLFNEAPLAIGVDDSQQS